MIGAAHRFVCCKGAIDMLIDEQGYKIVVDVIDPDTCDDLAFRCHGLQKSSAGSRRLLDHGWCRQVGMEIQSKLVRAIDSIDHLTLVQCTYFDKSPTSNWLVTWHQDCSVPVSSRVDSPELTGWSTKEGMTFVYGPDELLAKMLAVRLHLNDSLATNGPLRVIPGSHRFGTLSDAEIERQRHEREEVSCIVPKGGVLAMRPLILHASSKSTSTVPRRVLHFLFGPMTLPHGLQWAPIG